MKFWGTRNKKETIDPNTLHLERFDTLVGSSTIIEGRMTVHDSVRVDGQIYGNLEPADMHRCSIAIGPDAVIHGSITCHRAYIAGHVKGNIYAKEFVVVYEKALIEGDITSRTFHVATGARVLGSMLEYRNLNAKNQAQKRSVNL